MATQNFILVYPTKSGRNGFRLQSIDRKKVIQLITARRRPDTHAPYLADLQHFVDDAKAGDHMSFFNDGELIAIS